MQILYENNKPSILFAEPLVTVPWFWECFASSAIRLAIAAFTAARRSLAAAAEPLLIFGFLGLATGF